MTEYIDREAAIKLIVEDRVEITPMHLAIGNAVGGYTIEQVFDSINQACDRHIEFIKSVPSADVVSKAAYDQVAWERHLAEVQLKSIGKSIGEKMDDVQPVKHGFWYTEVYENVDLEYTIHVCSECEWESETKYNYCPRCGAKMDGEDNA